MTDTSHTDKTTRTKQMLNVREAAEYMGFSVSYVRKLAEQRRITHYKPSGKMLFFDRDDLDSFLRSVRVPSSADLLASMRSTLG